MWQSRFHGDANVLGGKILLYRKPYTVIGVMPRDFEFPLNPGHVNQGEFWLPLSLQPEEFTAGRGGSGEPPIGGGLKTPLPPPPGPSAAGRGGPGTTAAHTAHM